MITTIKKIRMPVIAHCLSIPRASPWSPTEHTPPQLAAHALLDHLIFKMCSLEPNSTFVILPRSDPSLSVCNETERILSGLQAEEAVSSSRVDSVWISGFRQCLTSMPVPGKSHIAKWAIYKAAFLPQVL